MHKITFVSYLENLLSTLEYQNPLHSENVSSRDLDVSLEIHFIFRFYCLLGFSSVGTGT